MSGYLFDVTGQRVGPSIMEAEVNNLGKTREIVRPETGLEFVALIKPEGCPEGAQLCTLAVQPDWRDDGFPAGLSPQFFNAKGRLQFGVGGGTHQVIFDLCAGVQLTVPAQSVALDVGFFENAPDVLGVIDRIRAAASIAWGSRPGGGALAPTFTSAQTEIAAGRSVVFRVPAFARAVRFFSPDAAAFAATTTYTLLGSPVAADAQTYAVITGAALGVPAARFGEVPLPEGARYVQVTNGALVPILVSLSFPLAM